MKKEIKIPEGHQARIEGNNVIIEPNYEDEKVRKWLITLLQNNYKGNYWANQAIAYLEKQKEQKSDDVKREWWNRGYLEGRKNAHIPARELGLPSSWDFQKEQAPEIPDTKAFQEGVKEGRRLEKEEQKSAEWIYPYGRNETVNKLVAIAECLEADGDCSFNGYSGTECGKFLRDLARKQVECKSEERNEGDDACYETIKGILEDNLTEEDKPEYVLSWFKSHYLHYHWKPGKEQGWSEKDERMLKRVIDTIGDSILECDCDDTGAKARFALEEERKWLKSLPERFK